MVQGYYPLHRALVRPPTVAEDNELHADRGKLMPKMPFLSFFLSAGLRGRLARPSGFQPARPPPCVSERTALGCLLTAAKTTKWELCFRVASPTP